uniref:Putative secreted protein n=1 Tax=Anopheles darlingi TaxID=43151 RepID=A0A2M4DLW1_ANODA
MCTVHGFFLFSCFFLCGERAAPHTYCVTAVPQRLVPWSGGPRTALERRKVKQCFRRRLLGSGRPLCGLRTTLPPCNAPGSAPPNL